MTITRREFIASAAAGTAMGLGGVRGAVAETGPVWELYHPVGYTVWDTWYLQLGETTHLYHLQKKWPGIGGPPELASIGHATSTDLIHWSEHPVALRPGPKGSYDEGSLFTGCTVEHRNKVYLFYCSNQNQVWGKSCRQAICLATSTDGRTFEKYSANPIIEPDPKRYYSYSEEPPPFKHHAWPWVDCRDLAVVRHPSRDTWLGYVVMRRKERDAFRSSCIALCRSRNLVDWSVGPPCCTPNRFNCFEVPDVFCLDGAWYMIALTGDNYGQSDCWLDPNIKHGTVVFRAESPEGPFEEIRDNLLLASSTPQGFSARTVTRRGERLMFYTRREAGGGSRLSLPIKLITTPEGALSPVYWSGIDKAFRSPISLEDIELEAASGSARQSLGEATADDSSFMVATDVSLDDCEAAGIAFRGTLVNDGYAALLDRKRGEVTLVSMPDFAPLQRIRREISCRVKIRVIVVGDFVEVYADDVLAIQQHCFSDATGACEVVVRRGAANFTRLRYYAARP